MSGSRLERTWDTEGAQSEQKQKIRQDLKNKHAFVALYSRVLQYNT